MTDNPYANVDPEDPAAYFEAVYAAVQEAIASVGNADAEVFTIMGQEARMLKYDPRVIFSALTHVMASYVVQSGNYVTKAQRRQLADAVRTQLLRGIDDAEKRLAESLKAAGMA